MPGGRGAPRHPDFIGIYPGVKTDGFLSIVFDAKQCAMDLFLTQKLINIAHSANPLEQHGQVATVYLVLLHQRRPSWSDLFKFFARYRIGVAHAFVVRILDNEGVPGFDSKYLSDGKRCWN